MKQKIFWLIGAALLAACSVQVSSSNNGDSYTLLPMATAIPTPTSPPAVPIEPPSLPALSLPSSVKLTGHLVYIQGVRSVVKLDLASGQIVTLFEGKDNAWITGASVSPDGKQVVMAYAPPTSDPAQMGYTALYTLPVDGSAAPKVLLQRGNDQETFFNPVWSMDGKYIYYSHEVQDSTSHQKYVTYKYILERASYPAGKIQQLADEAFWPRVSPDGKQLAYVSFNPSANANDLYIADLDGSHARLVMPAGDFFAVDAPLFSPDGQMIMFSAVGQPQVSQLSWFDQLLGVQVAEAHNVPSEWWRVPTADGKPQQLTNIADTGMYGDFSPDGQHVAFISANGLFVMNPDGTNLTQLAQGGPSGTVDWIP